MIGLALASHTFLNELEDRRCKKLGHRSTPDQPHKHCLQCFEAIRAKRRKVKPKKLLPAMLKSQDAPKEPKFEKTKTKSPSITSSSSAEFGFRPFSPAIHSTSPIESPIQRETIVVPRAHRLLATRELATKIYREAYEDRWHPEENPQGKINLCTAENNLCEDLLEEKLNDPQTWSGAIHSLHHYSQSGGFDWVKQAAINYVERFISTVGDPGLLPENITIVPGCRAAYDMIGFCLFEPGDAILTFVPFYSRLVDNFEERAQVRIVTADFKDFTAPRLDVSALQTAFEDAEQKNIRIRALSIVNPHNPLGVVFGENEILEACKWAVSKNLFIIADEVFASTISHDNRFRSLLSIRHQLGVKQRKKVIWMWSVSKDLCLPGARFGLVHTENKDLQKALRRLEILQPCAPVVQHLIGALFSDIDWFTTFNRIKNERLQENRIFVTSKLDDYGIEYFAANAALFIFVNLTEYIEDDTYEAEQKLWKRFTRAGVYLNPGLLLNSSTCGWFRLVISVQRGELEEGIKRLHAILLATEKRQLQRRTPSPQLDTPSQPISSATSEDELMKLIFTNKTSPSNLGEVPELTNEDLLEAVFATKATKKKAKKEKIEAPKIEKVPVESSSDGEEFEVYNGGPRFLNAGHKIEVEREELGVGDEDKSENEPTMPPGSEETPTQQSPSREATLSDQLYESIFAPSTVTVVQSQQTTVHQLSVFTEPPNQQTHEALKTTVQESRLPHQYSTISGSREGLDTSGKLERSSEVSDQTPDLLQYVFDGSNQTPTTSDSSKLSPKIINLTRVQHSDSQTTTYISKPQQVHSEQKIKMAPAEFLSDDIFETIFVTDHSDGKHISDDQTINDVAFADQPSGKHLSPIDFQQLTKMPSTTTVQESENRLICLHKDVELPPSTIQHQVDPTPYTTTKLQPFERSITSSSSEILETETESERYAASKEDDASTIHEDSASNRGDSTPRQQNPDRYTTSKHDSGIEIADYKDSKSHKTHSPLSDDVYETIFEVPADQQVPTKEHSLPVAKSDQDFRITTDLQAFSRRQCEVKQRKAMDPTLPERLIEEIFDPKIHQIYYTQSLPQMEQNDKELPETEQESRSVSDRRGSNDRPTSEHRSERRVSEGLLEKVFQPHASILSTQPKPEKRDYQRSEKDDQLTTDFGVFARAQQNEEKERQEPTMSDEQMERMFKRKSSTTRELIESLWEAEGEDNELASNERAIDVERKTMDFRRSERDDQITTDMSKFSRHQNAEQKKQLGEPTMSDKEVGAILRELWPGQSSGEENEEEKDSSTPKEVQSDSKNDKHSSDNNDQPDFSTSPDPSSLFQPIQHSEHEFVVKEVHSPTFVQHFEYIEVQPQHSIQKAQEVQPTPLSLQVDTTPDDLLAMVFEREGQEKGKKCAENEEKKQFRPAKNEKDQQINDGLTFPKRVDQEKRGTGESTLTEEHYSQIFEEMSGSDAVNKDNLQKCNSETINEEHSQNRDSEPSKTEPKPQEDKPKVQKHVRIAEVEHEKIEEPSKPTKSVNFETQENSEKRQSTPELGKEHEYFEHLIRSPEMRSEKLKETDAKNLEMKKVDEECKKDPAQKSPDLDNMDKYGTMLDNIPHKSDESHQNRLTNEDQREKQDEFARVFEDQNREPSKIQDEFDDAYSIKPLLTDFSFIEDLVKESIQRRQKQQYRPDMDQYRLSLVEELSETSATPKGSSGSPISRRSLRGSIKEKGDLVETEGPLNEDIFGEQAELEKDRAEVLETREQKEPEKRDPEELKKEEEMVNSLIDTIFEPIHRQAELDEQKVKNEEGEEQKANNEEGERNTLQVPPMEPLHIDVDTDPLQSSTLRRGQFNDPKQREMNDSGIGMETSSGGSLTIEFPLLYSSRHEAGSDSTFTTEELRSLVDQPLDHWPKKREDGSSNRPKFESAIQEEKKKARSLLTKSDSALHTPPIYSETDIWGILGTAQDKQDKKVAGSLRQILKKKRLSESSADDDTLKLNSSISSESGPSRRESVDLNVRIRSISPSPLMSSQDEGGHSTTMQIGSRPKAKIYQRRHQRGTNVNKSRPAQSSSVANIIDSYNKSVKGQKEVFPDVRVTSHHRYIKSKFTKSEDPLLADTSQVHHTMIMERRPKSLSPHSSRRVVLEHTNITEIVYDSNEKLAVEERPELIKTKASTRVNSLGTKELLNTLVFDNEKEPRNEKAERYVEFRRQRHKDKGQSRVRTSGLYVENQNQSDSTSADDTTDFQRTQSGRMQRGVQTKRDSIDLCCKMRLIQKDEEQKKEFVMCRNPSHSDKHDHCNPKRLYIVKKSTIPKKAGEQKIQLTADPHDVLTISNSSNSNSTNSIDRVKVRHTPGSRWLVSSICKTTKYGFERKMLQPDHLKQTEAAPSLRSPLYNSD